MNKCFFTARWVLKRTLRRETGEMWWINFANRLLVLWFRYEPFFYRIEDVDRFTHCCHVHHTSIVSARAQVISQRLHLCSSWFIWSTVFVITKFVIDWPSVRILHLLNDPSRCSSPHSSYQHFFFHCSLCPKPRSPRCQRLVCSVNSLPPLHHLPSALGFCQVLTQPSLSFSPNHTLP